MQQEGYPLHRPARLQLYYAISGPNLQDEANKDQDTSRLGSIHRRLPTHNESQAKKRDGKEEEA